MTTFHTPKNNAATTVASPRSVAAASLVVADGSAFPASGPFLITLSRGPAATETILSILEATARTSNTLTISGAVEGTTDVALVAGDRVQMRPTAGAITEIHTAVNAVETALPGKLGTTGDGSGLTGLTKGQVGLGNVDNTSDASKPVSTATATALAGKQTLDATLTALAGLTIVADSLPYGTGSDTFGTATLSTYGRTLIDDADAATARGTLVLGNVDNTSDAGKPISTATATALAGKLATTGDGSGLTGLTKSQVGLGNVDNTSDANKPVSTATTTALAGKQDASAKLTALVGLAWAADKLAYLTGAATAALADLSTYMRGLLGSADAATARGTLGLGTIATHADTDYLTPTGNGSGLTALTAANISAGTAGISISGNAATATNGVVTSGSYGNPAWITSLAETKVLPSQTSNSGKYLTTNGTASSWATVSVTVDESDFVHKSGNETITGMKSFIASSQDFTVQATGGAAILNLAATNDAYLQAIKGDASSVAAFRFLTGSPSSFVQNWSVGCNNARDGTNNFTWLSYGIGGDALIITYNTGVVTLRATGLATTYTPAWSVMTYLGHPSQFTPLTAYQAYSSTSVVHDAGYVDSGFADNTEGSTKGYIQLAAQDAAATSGGRVGVRVESDGSAATIALGGGAKFKAVLSAVATLDFPSVAAGSQQELTVSVTGAATGDAVHVGRPSGLESGLIVTARATAADTVTVRASNITGSAIDPASASYRAVVFKY